MKQLKLFDFDDSPETGASKEDQKNRESPKKRPEEKEEIEPLFPKAIKDIKTYSDWDDPFRNTVYPTLIQPKIDNGLNGYAEKILAFFTIPLTR